MPSVLIINGSPHADGPTAAMLGAFRENLGLPVKQFACFAENPIPCDDCRACHRDGRCDKRDLDGFYADFEEADLLVFASPVYNRSYPAPMKAALDRLQRYWAMRFKLGIRPPIQKPKSAVMFTASGSGRDKDGEQLETQLRPQLTVLNTHLVVCVHAMRCDEGLEQRFLDAAASAGILAKGLLGENV